MKKKQIIYRPDEQVFEIDGKKFKPKKVKTKKVEGVEHVDYEVWEEIDEEEYNKHLETIKKAIIDKIPKERIVDEILKKYSTSALKTMAKQIKEKKAKVSRHDGCLGIKIDGGKHNSSYIEFFG